MKRADKAKLDELDMQLLRAALVMQNLFTDRAKMDPSGTEKFLDMFVRTLQEAVARGKETPSEQL